MKNVYDIIRTGCDSMNAINRIIDRYRRYEDLYNVLKNYYVREEQSEEEQEEKIEEIKEIVAEYYLYIYPYEPIPGGNFQDSLLTKISQVLDLQKKVREKDGKIKIYPIKESNEKKEASYKEVIRRMVDYQIENRMYIEGVFDAFTKSFSEGLERYKKELTEKEMEPFYGSPNYMIERSKLMIDCIRRIPGTNYDLDEIERLLALYQQKYIDGRDSFRKDDEYIVEDEEEFLDDYETIEACYKRLLAIEKELSPKVVEYWKEYLTDPNKKEDDYRYLMHSFTKGLVEPDKMHKACCSLYTREIDSQILGEKGLIYDVDVDSIDTMCTEDAGSWVINKKKFFDMVCPSRWQLTKQDGSTVYYECPRNSKIIMPSLFEQQCLDRIRKGKFQYSEFFLNEHARALGVFYTSDCKNIEEVQEYAGMHNLPLVFIPTQEKKSKYSS